MSKKKKRYRGHYCKVCGSILPNEKFSGKGHARHLCKKCSKLSKGKQEEAITLNRIDRVYRYDEEFYFSQNGDLEEDLFDHEDQLFEVFGYDDEPPSDHEIAEQNEAMLDRQRQFRFAAEYVTAAFANIPSVEKVLLIGSVALPLKKEVPRFKQFRRHKIPVWHECKDVDIAVWISNLDDLKKLQQARSQALKKLLNEKEIGVAHHQVDVFVIESGTDRYLGRLCNFGQCPKGKKECNVPGCGRSLFLQQLNKFTFDYQSIAEDRSEVLFFRNLFKNAKS